jgi:tetratricopeptide (TPR) repeat protein
MEKAVTLDPDYLDARVGLYQFYQRAPWPIGSNAKATAQLEAIRQRNPALATTLAVGAKADAKDYATAFQLCERVLAEKPADYTALYQYGRTASVSGQNLERGIAALEKCLAQEPPSPSLPSHSNVWFRIGVIRQKRSQLAEARAAFAQALQLDSGNQQAADALAKLK